MKGKLKFPRVLECEIYWPSEYRVDLSSIKANLLELFRSKRMKKKKYSSTFFPVLRSQIKDRIRRKKLYRPRQNVSLSMHRIFSIIDNRYSMVSRRNRRVCGFVAASSARERVPTCISLLRHDPRDLSVERNDRWIDKFVTGGCGGKTVLTIFLR